MASLDLQLAGLINSHGKQPEMVTVDELQKVRAQIRQQLQEQAGYMDGAIALSDAVFPQPRGQVKNSEQPVVLFYRGDLGLLSLESPNIAVMSAPTNVQIISDADGHPAFVVIPYADYVRSHPQDDLVPNEVVGYMVRGLSSIAAWRQHLVNPLAALFCSGKQALFD